MKLISDDKLPHRNPIILKYASQTPEEQTKKDKMQVSHINSTGKGAMKQEILCEAACGTCDTAKEEHYHPKDIAILKEAREKVQTKASLETSSKTKAAQATATRALTPTSVPSTVNLVVNTGEPDPWELDSPVTGEPAKRKSETVLSAATITGFKASGYKEDSVDEKVPGEVSPTEVEENNVVEEVTANNKETAEKAEITDVLVDEPTAVDDTSGKELVVEKLETEEIVEEAIKEDGVEQAVESESTATEVLPCNTIFRSVLTNHITESNMAASTGRGMPRPRETASPPPLTATQPGRPPLQVGDPGRAYPGQPTARPHPPGLEQQIPPAPPAAPRVGAWPGQHFLPAPRPGGRPGQSAETGYTARPPGPSGRPGFPIISPPHQNQQPKAPPVPEPGNRWQGGKEDECQRRAAGRGHQCAGLHLPQTSNTPPRSAASH